MRPDIVAAFLKHNHLEVKKGQIQTNEIFMPYILMDLVYQRYTTDFMKFKFKEHPYWKGAWRKRYGSNVRLWKECRKLWKEVYNGFNAIFFEAFDDDQTYEVIDSMAALEEVAESGINKLGEAIGSVLVSCHPEERMMLEGLLVCSTLARTAQAFWRRFYALGGEFKPNPDIDAINNAIFALIAISYTGSEDISFNNSPAMDEAVSELCNTLVSWARIKEE